MKAIAVIISMLALASGVYAQGAGSGGAGAGAAGSSGGSGPSGASGVGTASGAGTFGQPSSVGNARIGAGTIAPGNPAPALGSPMPGSASPNPNLGNVTPGGIGTPAPGIGNPVPNVPNPAAQPGVSPDLTPGGVPNPANSANLAPGSSALGQSPNPAFDRVNPLRTPNTGLNATNGLAGTVTNRFRRPGSRGFGQNGTATNGLVPLSPPSASGASGTSVSGSANGR